LPWRFFSRVTCGGRRVRIPSSEFDGFVLVNAKLLRFPRYSHAIGRKDTDRPLGCDLQHTVIIALAHRCERARNVGLGEEGGAAAHLTTRTAAARSARG